MQFSVLTTLFFAALATAHSHQGHAQRFHHRRALNESALAVPTSSVADLTTLTVQTTVVHTILSCAQNVTDCPAAAATGARTVTEVVDLTTTVCPVAEASAISSSVIASASQNNAAVATPTAAPTSAEVEDSILTYTLGAGTSKTVITTTIKHTKTATAYTTKYMTYDGTNPAPTPVVEVNDNSPVNGNEPTTTIRSTQTSTIIVTVPSASSTAPATGSSVGGEGSDSDCAAPVTVTVALSTVTVTYTPPAAEATVPAANNAAASPSAPLVTAGQGAENPTVTAAPEAFPITTLEPEVVTSRIVVVPVPYGNNTGSASTRSAPSGFLTFHRPMGTGSEIVPAPTGGARK